MGKERDRNVFATPPASAYAVLMGERRAVWHRKVRNGEGSGMSDQPGMRLAAGSSEAAPFVYADGVATFGVLNGVVQLELAANTVVPDGAGTRIEPVCTCHLRLSMAAAASLRDVIGQVLAQSTQQRECSLPKAALLDC